MKNTITDITNVEEQKAYDDFERLVHEGNWKDIVIEDTKRKIEKRVPGQTFHKFHEGEYFTDGMESSSFAKVIRAVVDLSKRNNAPKFVKKTVLFPEFEGDDPRVITMRAVLEYFFNVLSTGPVQQRPAKLVEAVRRIKPHVNESYPEVSSFIDEKVKIVPSWLKMDRVKQEFNNLKKFAKENTINVCYSAFQLVKNLGKSITKKDPPDKVNPCFSSLEGLCKLPEVSLEKQNGDDFLVLNFSYLNPEYIFKIPMMDGVYWKGGVSRLLLKILARESIPKDDPRREKIQKYIVKELPLNDYDSCIDEVPNLKKLMEYTGDDDISSYDEEWEGVDPILFLANRDGTINSAILTPYGLCFSSVGLESAIDSKNMPMYCDQGIFGNDAIVQGFDVFATGRTLERNTKPSIEEKIRYLELKLGDLAIDMGVFILGSAIRWLGKDAEWGSGERSAALLNRMCILHKKIGQWYRRRDDMKAHMAKYPEVAEYPDILLYLDCVHEQFPFANMDRGNDPLGKLDWGVKKVATRSIKDFKKQFGLTTPLPHKYVPAHSKKILFDLEQGMPSDEEMRETEERIKQYLPAFLKRCEERNRKFQEENKGDYDQETLFTRAVAELAKYKEDAEQETKETVVE